MRNGGRADALIQEKLLHGFSGQSATGGGRKRSSIKWNMPWDAKGATEPEKTPAFNAPRDLRVRDTHGTYTTRVVGAAHQRRIRDAL